MENSHIVSILKADPFRRRTTALAITAEDVFPLGVGIEGLEAHFDKVEEQRYSSIWGPKSEPRVRPISLETTLKVFVDSLPNEESTPLFIKQVVAFCLNVDFQQVRMNRYGENIAFVSYVSYVIMRKTCGKQGRRLETKKVADQFGMSIYSIRYGQKCVKKRQLTDTSFSRKYSALEQVFRELFSANGGQMKLSNS